MPPPDTNVPSESALSEDMATVTLTVAGLNDVCVYALFKPNRLTSYTMDHEPDRAGNVSKISNDTLHVKAPGATIRFKIAHQQGKETFYPVGIAFVQEPPATNDSERLGLQPFVRRHGPDAQYLIVDDRFPKTEQRIQKRFKFSIVIQRGSDGKLGIIDPGVVNES